MVKEWPKSLTQEFDPRAYEILFSLPFVLMLYPQDSNTSCCLIDAPCYIWNRVSVGIIGSGRSTRTTGMMGTTHRVDPWQLLAHVHDDDGDQLPAKGALGQQAQHRQVALGPLRLVLQMHLCQLCIHVVPATQTLQRCGWQATQNTIIYCLYC